MVRICPLPLTTLHIPPSPPSPFCMPCMHASSLTVGSLCLWFVVTVGSLWHAVLTVGSLFPLVSMSDHRKWIRSVRFTPRGLEKKRVGLICRIWCISRFPFIARLIAFPVHCQDRLKRPDGRCRRVGLSQNVKTKHRVYRTWIRSVRFTTRGFEKKELG